MDHKSIEKLEHELEIAMAELLERLESKRFPRKPSPLTVHLMAKAAATVYEAVIEAQHDERM